MRFRRMTCDEITHWYETELTEAFIPQERKPLAEIFRLQEEGRYELWGLFDAENSLLGYACLWLAPEVPLVLLDYLGVTKRLRNGGLGSEILRLLQAQKRPLVTESELPVAGDSDEDNRIRLRRIAFYQRNGFTPAYPMATCGMAWQALTFLPRPTSMEDVMAWHRALYGPQRTDVQVPLPPGGPLALPHWMV